MPVTFSSPNPLQFGYARIKLHTSSTPAKESRVGQFAIINQNDHEYGDDEIVLNDQRLVIPDDLKTAVGVATRHLMSPQQDAPTHGLSDAMREVLAKGGQSDVVRQTLNDLMAHLNANNLIPDAYKDMLSRGITKNVFSMPIIVPHRPGKQGFGIVEYVFAKDHHFDVVAQKPTDVHAADKSHHKPSKKEKKLLKKLTGLIPIIGKSNRIGKN